MHTRRHFAGRLETHSFFSRAAVHAALWDLWAPTSPRMPTPDVIPYGSTPLWADRPDYVEISYAGINAHKKKRRARVNVADLSVGTMEALRPGTVLSGAMWGDEEHLPPISQDRGFWIGKGRAAARISRVELHQADLKTGRLGGQSLPVEIARPMFGSQSLAGLAYRRLAEAPGYIVARLAPGCDVPHVEVEGQCIPMLDRLKEAE